jgi:SAM-dependent methyltransferase
MASLLRPAQASQPTCVDMATRQWCETKKAKLKCGEENVRRLCAAFCSHCRPNGASQLPLLPLQRLQLPSLSPPPPPPPPSPQPKLRSITTPRVVRTGARLPQSQSQPCIDATETSWCHKKMEKQKCDDEIVKKMCAATCRHCKQDATLLPAVEAAGVRAAEKEAMPAVWARPTAALPPLSSLPLSTLFEKYPFPASCCREQSNPTWFLRRDALSPTDSPSACFAGCLAMERCFYFSHSARWHDCIFCENCDFDSKLPSSSFYTSWTRVALPPPPPFPPRSPLWHQVLEATNRATKPHARSNIHSLALPVGAAKGLLLPARPSMTDPPASSLLAASASSISPENLAEPVHPHIFANVPQTTCTDKTTNTDKTACFEVHLHVGSVQAKTMFSRKLGSLLSQIRPPLPDGREMLGPHILDIGCGDGTSLLEAAAIAENHTAEQVCAAGLTNYRYNYNLIGGRHFDRGMAKRFFEPEWVRCYPHFSVTGGNVGRAALEGVARQSEICMPRRTPTIVGGDFSIGLNFQDESFDSILSQAVLSKLDLEQTLPEKGDRPAAWSKLANELLRVMRHNGSSAMLLLNQGYPGYNLHRYTNRRASPSALFDGNDFKAGLADRNLSAEQQSWLKTRFSQTGALPLELMVGVVHSYHHNTTGVPKPTGRTCESPRLVPDHRVVETKHRACALVYLYATQNWTEVAQGGTSQLTGGRLVLFLHRFPSNGHGLCLPTESRVWSAMTHGIASFPGMTKPDVWLARRGSERREDLQKLRAARTGQYFDPPADAVKLRCPHMYRKFGRSCIPDADRASEATLNAVRQWTRGPAFSSLWVYAPAKASRP